MKNLLRIPIVAKPNKQPINKASKKDNKFNNFQYKVSYFTRYFILNIFQFPNKIPNNYLLRTPNNTLQMIALKLYNILIHQIQLDKIMQIIKNNIQ